MSSTAIQPGKRQQAADDALARVLELFESGELPEAIARTVIHRAESDAPIGQWSLGNQLLALLAGTMDARGFKQWKDANRSVVKGAKAFYILAPCKRKIRDKDEHGVEVDKVIITGFIGIPVFRFEDTDGAPLEQADYQPAEFPPLYAAAARLGVTVEYAPFADRYYGFYQPSSDRIVLCTHDAETFFHELAHRAHDIVLRERGSALKGGQVASQEIVAEVCAAVLCQLYGFEGFLPHAHRYVESYAKGQTPGRAAMRVLADVQAVLALLLSVDGLEAAAPAPVAALAA